MKNSASFDEATKMELDKEAARIKEHRDQAKKALMNPGGYLPVAIDEKLADGLHKLEFEFENLVNDSESTIRNSKFEALGKYGAVASIAIQACVYLVGFLALLIYSVYVNHRKCCRHDFFFVFFFFFLLIHFFTNFIISLDQLPLRILYTKPTPNI
jgi:hypothetical protein